MLLSEIPAGSSLLCDANVMVYGMLQAEPFAAVCRAFLERAARREITVYIAASSAADVIHRAMVSEAEAVLLPVERYNAMLDLLEDREDELDSALGRRIQEERQAYARGEGRDLESFAAEIEA